METRELYKQKYEAQLKEWGAKIETIHAKADKTAAQVQIDLKPHLDSVKTRFEAARAHVSHLTKATDDAWGGVKKDADHAWHEFKSSVEGAFAALKKHQPPPTDGTKPTV